MKYKITDKCPLTVLLQVAGGQTYDLSAHGTKETAWESEKQEYWVEITETQEQAREEFMSSVFEYDQEQVVSAAFDEQAWPFDWGYVTETEEEIK